MSTYLERFILEGELSLLDKLLHLIMNLIRFTLSLRK